MDIDRMTSQELTNYITRNGEALLDINRLAEAIHKGKVKKVVLPNGQEIDITEIAVLRSKESLKSRIPN